MTTITTPKKAVAVNPLKLSQPFGAALAFLGLKGTVPLFHGSQGCTAFAKTLLVRHFREAIPLSTTAMNEVSTVLGGEDNIETAIAVLLEKSKPAMISLLTTGLTETRGEDMVGILKSIRKRRPEWDNIPIIYVSTPDYKGAMQDGFAAAVESIVATDYGTNPEIYTNNVLVTPPAGYSALPCPPSSHTHPQVTILASPMLAPGDVEEIKEMVEAFGLKPLMIPDLAGSLDGHLEDDFHSVTTGGATVEQLRQMHCSIYTLAIGESMRTAAEILKARFGIQYELFPRLAGLKAIDSFLWRLAQIVNSRHDPHVEIPPQVPDKYKRQRRQLQDAILDTHFYFGRKRVALGLEPDLLYQTSWLLHEMGVEIHAAVTPTKSPLLKDLPIESVTIGDLEDLEMMADGADLLITNSHGDALAKKLGIPLYRMGYPIYDRLGNGHRRHVGYRGTMQFLFDVGNMLLDYEVANAHH
ncbi:nitrogenase iron-molybdenum cofactor biosynthesis protein NifN [Pannus brasiliensis CCIBt3594]|uniref:Nitrogenase iron-molybdenum cofactor biosynthesis protein NifN n=1 Tax=Pannus brasiliensis CCIBt3594 TaxID=1427578 RepID=A0AAW9QTG6_9CHRO